MKTRSISPGNAIGRLVVLIALAILAFSSNNVFAQTPVSLNIARQGHTATVLADGRVLVFGGDAAGSTEATAEIVDVAAGTSTNVALNGIAARTGHTATRLADGRVLIAGGSESGVPVSSTFFIDAAGNVSPGPNMASARSGHTAVYFSGTNNVLFIGGDSTGTAEVLDVAAGTSQHTPSNMSTPRSGHSSVVMNDGRVLVVGGDGLNTAEIFDGSSFTAIGNAMTLARSGALLRTLPDGKVQIIGGNGDGSMEVYDPAIDTIGAYAHVIPSTDYCRSLQDGVKASQTRAALFGANIFGAPFDRTGAAIVELGSQALIIGGSNGGTAITPIASSGATVTTDKLDYAPGETATITGTGFGPNETINIVIHEDPKPSADHIERKLTTTSDANGNFTISYQVEQHDLNLKFILNARGATSGTNAQTTFTDGRKIEISVSVPGPLASANATITHSRFENTTCSGSPASGPTAATLTDASTQTIATDPAALNGSQSIKLVASPTAANGTSFTGWSYSRSGGGSAISVDLTQATICFNGDGGSNNNNQGTHRFTANYSAVVATSLTVSPATGTYGGTTSLSATLKKSAAPNDPISGKTINFTLNGTPVGTAVTDASGIATLANVSLSGINAGSYVTGVGASFAAGGGFGGSSGDASLTVNAKSISASFTASNKVYDGNTTATIATRTITQADIVGGDVVTLQDGTATFDNKNVGTDKVVTGTGFTLGGAQAANYTLGTVATTKANITAKGVTISGVSANSRPYNGNTNATLSFAGATLVGVAGGDTVTIDSSSYTASFADKSVGTAKTVTVTGVALGGADAGNYTLTQPTGLTADITALHITGGFTTQSRAYDATTAAAVLTRTLNGAISGDDVTLTGGTAAFADKNVGTNKTVTLTGATLAGADAGNYVLDSVNTATADITALHLTGSFTAANKAYDGTTSATVLTRSLSGVIAGDSVTLDGGTAAFDTKTAGTGKTVTLTGATLGGADAGNYILDSVANATADITPLHITGTFATQNKVYDGTTVAAVLSSSLTGVITGDTVSLSGGTAAFADKNVGTGKTVTLTGATLGGADAANYVLDSVADATADITPLHVTGSFTTQNKTYDGTTSAVVVTRTLNGAITGDDIALGGGTATFADKNVGAGKTVTLSGAALSGGDAGNYVLDSVSTATADITALHITGSFTTQNKQYDGNATAVVLTRSLAGAVGGDNISLDGGTAAFDSKNVGTGKTVTLSGATLGGTDAGNYVLDSVATATADITALHITGSFTAADKIYDATTAATVLTRTLTGVIGSDDVTLDGGTATFADKHAATGKVVTLSGASLTGADAGNYALDSVNTDLADITPRALVITAAGVDKVYDATTNATVTLSDDRISGDVFTASYTSASFADKNVGGGKTISVSGISITGTDAGNYSPNTTATASASITPATLTPSITANDKVYDGTTTATLSSQTVATPLGADVVSLVVGAASFDTKIVGTGKTVTATGLSLGGVDAGNYQLSSTTASDTADITALNLTISGAVAADRVYNALTNASVNFSGASLVTPVSGDSVVLDTTGYSASFADKNVGLDKPVTVSGVALTGSDAGNYTLTQPTGLTADITPLMLEGTFTAHDKVYDATTAAAVKTQLLQGNLGTDDVNLQLANVVFNNKNAGTGKLVTADLSLTGGDAPNYTVNSSATTTATITPLGLAGSFTANSRNYDGTTAASVATQSLPGVLGTDAVTLVVSNANFNDKNVGTGKTVTAALSLAGADAGNYTVSATATTQADILAATVTGSFTANSKIYDGNNSATIATRSITGGVVGTEDVTLTGGSATFDDKNVGTGKLVTGTGFTLGGTDAGNYALASATLTTNADITALGLTGSFTAANKVYDGNTNALVNGRSVTGFIPGDMVSLTGGTAAFNDKNVGTGKTVTLTGASLTGADAGNYSLSSVSTTTADITAKAITGNFTVDNKVYDGTTAASIAGRSLNGNVTGDAVTLSGGTATFADRNVGNGKVVSGTGFTLSGVDAGNYSLASVGTTTANITPRLATWTTNPNSKNYGFADPNPLTTGSGDFLAIDNVTATYSRVVGESAGTYQITATLNSSGLTNYTITNNGALFTIKSWWTLNGFYQPVGIPNTYGTLQPPTVVWNTIKGGQTVPLKFNILAGNVEQTTTAAVTLFTAQEMGCTAVPSTGEDEIEITSTGGTTLRYSGTPGVDGQFIQNWQTPKAADKCYRVVMRAADGSYLVSFFKTKK